MRRAQRNLVVLLLGVAVLIALALWQWHGARVGATLLDLDPARITRVDVTRRGQPTQHYVRRAGHWYRPGATAARVDDAYLDSLVALAGTPVLQWRDAAAVDLANIGLATPLITVRLDGHALAYGALAAFGPQRFVRVGSRIAVVPASYSPRSAPAASASSSQKS